MKSDIPAEFLQKSIQPTKGRLSVFSILEKSTVPLSVEEICEQITRLKVSLDRATVFRIINLFTDVGITKKIELNEGKFRYELTSLPHHHHLVCRSCSSVQDVRVHQDLSLEEKRISKEQNFYVLDHTLEFYGVCKNCQ